VQPRNRHIVAVFALLVSSVCGFLPPTRATISNYRYHPDSTVAPPAAATLLHGGPLRCGRCQQGGAWSCVGERRGAGGLCPRRLARGRDGAPELAGSNSAFVGRSTSAAAVPPAWWRSGRRASKLAMMALHFPKPPKMPKPLPSPSGGKTPGAGGSGSSPAGAAGSAGKKGWGEGTSGSGSGSAPSPHQPSKVNGGAATTGGLLDASTLSTRARDVPAGRGNATRTDLNAGKVSKDSNDHM